MSKARQILQTWDFFSSVFCFVRQCFSPSSQSCSPASEVYFWSCRECLPLHHQLLFSLCQLSQSQRFFLGSIGKYVHHHSMQAPYCKGLEKLLTLLIHKLDPADWPGATDVVASIFLCEQEERNKKGGTRGENGKGACLTWVYQATTSKILCRGCSYSTPHPGIRGLISLISTSPGGQVPCSISFFTTLRNLFSSRWGLLHPSVSCPHLSSLSLYFSVLFLLYYSPFTFFPLFLSFSFFFFSTGGPAANIGFQKMFWTAVGNCTE